MNHRNQISKSFVDRLFLCALIVAAIFIAFPKGAMAQKPSDAQLKSAMTFCLFGRFPGVKEKRNRIWGQVLNLDILLICVILADHDEASTDRVCRSGVSPHDPGQ